MVDDEQVTVEQLLVVVDEQVTVEQPVRPPPHRSPVRHRRQPFEQSPARHRRPAITNRSPIRPRRPAITFRSLVSPLRPAVTLRSPAPPLPPAVPGKSLTLSPSIHSYESPTLRSPIPFSLDSRMGSREKVSASPATADQAAPVGNRKVTTK